MTITFTNPSGARSMPWRSAVDLLRAWMLHGNIPEAAQELLPSPSRSWSDDDPHWVIEEIWRADLEEAADQMVGSLSTGGFSYLSGEDGKGLAEFLRWTADIRDGKFAGTMIDWTPPHDELQSPAALRELADFFDVSDFGKFDTMIQVSPEDQPEADEPESEGWSQAATVCDPAATIEVGK